MVTKPDEDYFVCPNCGTEVGLSAKVCPECGADDETGWNADAFKFGTVVQPEEDFDYEETLRRHEGRKSFSLGKVIVAMLLLISVLIYFFRNY